MDVFTSAVRLKRTAFALQGSVAETALEGDKFEDALTERTRQWRAEHASSETERSPATTREAASELEVREAESESDSRHDKPTKRQPAPQELNADPSANALTKHGGTSGTCNNMTCYCAIA